MAVKPAQMLVAAGALLLGLWQPAVSKSSEGERDARPVVRVAQGAVRGIGVEGGFAFKGVPYAAPPIAANRWRAPQAASSWKGVRNAFQFGPSCPQLAMGWNNVDAKRASEDCLSLNIWTPSINRASDQPLLPVMVWINGGGFSGGSASNNFNDGTKLMRHGVVVVTINYRLSVLGFLAHPDLARESSDGSTGNYGLLDQVAALQWVHDNIAVFGGDPRNVTMFGQSAGAISIAWLMTSERTRGLFHRAILESGNAFGSGLINTERSEAEQAGQQFGDLATLRRLPVSKLLNRWEKFESQAPQSHFARPIVDGSLIRKQPAQALLEGAARAFAIIVGSNSQEFVLNLPPEQQLPMIAQWFGNQADKAAAFYLPGGTARPDDPLLGSAGTQLAADVTFRCSAILSARASGPAWIYQFEQPRSGEVVTAHSHELVYVFGNWGTEWPLKQPMSPSELILLDRMQSYWSNFARTGNPNGPELPLWPKFNRDEDSYLAISAQHATASTHLRGDICPLYTAHWSDPASYNKPSKQ